MASKRITALVQKDGTLSKEEILTPRPGEHQVLVKVSHVAQNPTDVQSLDCNAFGDGAVLGCDFVGTVEDLGPSVSCFRKGTQIAGLIWGGEIKGLGGYSTCTLADERICFPMPDGTKPEEAATVPLAACTAWLALFSEDCLGINRQSEHGVSDLGLGRKFVGLYTVQLAVLFGLDVIATCSPRHHDNVRSLGAKHVLDYRDPDIVTKIKQAAPGLRYVFDTIGNENSSSVASSAIQSGQGVICTVRPGKLHTKDVANGVKITDVLVWAAFLKKHRYGTFVWPAKPKDDNLATKLFKSLPKWLSTGKIKSNRTKVYDYGLNAVNGGFQEYRDGKISNYKIVYSL